MSTELSEPTYDPDTLHESYPDADAVTTRIAELRAEVRDAPDEVAELMARGDLVGLLRCSGTLDDALSEGLAAVDRADIAGTAAQQHTARVRLAQVHQWRGEYPDSTVLVTELLAAAGQFGPVVEAFTHQQAGFNDYDQGHWSDAVEHFARASTIRDELELPDDECAVSRLSLTAARRHQAAGS